MQKSNLFLRLLLAWLVCFSINAFYLMTGAAEAAEEDRVIHVDTKEGQEENRKILVELFLARERKSDIDKIKQELEALSISRIRPQFFRLGNPPENIAIGKNIPAPVARVAMRLAITYNRGIKYLLPEFRYFPDHIVIGSSAFDESSQIPVAPEDVEKLLNPELSTEEFHNLYRHLTGEDVQLPKYTD
ncbi:hypothetical protein [Candidatus Manganitrophus noduliformans]|uniref:Uncharacterized protein n=1 Tax=Candidatus Manganitrophus noduliformans TaxID=2606439 RepID=A0A7X6I9U9_9BACT|nr:hypothetical protein [Candidatus Manganitrophus noduliformans]NKE70031.1 hypothetical protein [Candidatus Manganitrophus noduliformans]